MKRLIIKLMLMLCIASCAAQKAPIKDLSEEVNTNYILARLSLTEISHFELYNRSFFVKTYKIYDSKATPEKHFEGTDEVLSSILISIVPDGDYYTTSKLFKIEGLLKPKIISVEEIKYPNFMVFIESGANSNRIVKEYIFNGGF